MKRSASSNRIDSDERSRQRVRADDGSTGTMSALFRALETQSNGMNAIPVDATSPAANNQNVPSGHAAFNKADLPVRRAMNFPKPRNFAERLMFVLESEVAKDAIWWVEGKAVALHQKRLKKGTVMQEYFNVKDFSGFIRNCNRWGFRRVSSYDVPGGVLTYESSLFVKDNLQLVKHMRMDSDIQDIFAKHIALANVSSNSYELSDQSCFARLPMELQSIVQRYRQQKAATTQNAQFQSGMPSLLVKQHSQQLPEARHLGQQQSLEQQQPLQQVSTLQKGGREKPHHLLRQIMDLSQKYLENPESNSHNGIRTILQLLNVLGQKEIRQQDERERQEELQRARQQQEQLQQGNSAVDVVNQLVAQLMAQGQQPQPQQQQGKSLAVTGNVNSGNANMAPSSPQPQTQHPVPGNDSNQMFLKLLGGGGRPGAAQPPNQPVGNFAGLPTVQGNQQLLAFWAQRQQQQYQQ